MLKETYEAWAMKVRYRDGTSEVVRERAFGPPLVRANREDAVVSASSIDWRGLVAIYPVRVRVTVEAMEE